MSVRVCLCLCVSVPVSPSQLPNARAVSIYLTFKTHAMFDLAHLCGQDWHPKDHISFHPNLKKDILHESETRAVSEIGVMSEVCERDVWHLCICLTFDVCVRVCVCVCLSVCLSVRLSVDLSTSRPLDRCAAFLFLGPFLIISSASSSWLIGSLQVTLKDGTKQTMWPAHCVQGSKVVCWLASISPHPHLSSTGPLG